MSTLFRNAIKRYSPVWLSDRPGQLQGPTVGYRFLWVLAAGLDVLAEHALQGLRSWLPGVGTPTALALTGRSRGILRGKSDTNADYAARQNLWLDRWPRAGSREAIAQHLHDYLAGRPQVDVVNRAGTWTRIGADGTKTEFRGVPWNWDNVSNPERTGVAISDLWVIIRTPYPVRQGTTGMLTAASDLATNGVGHLVPTTDVDEVKGLLATWKGAHSRIRCMIWCSDPTLFDPTNAATLPDGTWGQWGNTGSGSRTRGGRNMTSCRYWEPN